MPLSRRHLLHWIATSPLLSLPMNGMAQEANAREARIADVIREYSAQGYHRTGTAVDTVSGAWLADRIQALGVPSFLDPVPFERVNVIYTSFAFDGMLMEGVPLYDCHYTDVEGVTGVLGALDSGTDIGVLMLPATSNSPAHERLAQARRNHAHKAIVVVTDASYPADGVATLNAEDYRSPFGPPVLQVPNRHWSAIQAAMSAGETGTVVALCERVPGTAYNVSARIEGRNPDLAPMVIMTPRSGWWRCASERGGGLALMLELMQDLLASQPARTVFFTANSGHELSHLGMDQMMEENPTLAAGANLWIHLGANFAATGSQIRLQYAHDGIRQMSQRRLRDLRMEPDVETPLGTRPLGEARNIHDVNGHYLSLLGSNPLFHHPDDRWPTAVDVSTTARWAEAFSRIVLPLAQA